MSPEDRFREKIFYDTVNGCWLFMSSWNAKGYGRFWVGGRSREAHRWSYEHFVGTIPAGLHIDHLCRVRCCVNPDHLEPVTHYENFRRGNGPTASKPQERCRSGRHLMAETRVFRGKNRLPRCRTCELERTARYAVLRKEVMPDAA